MIKIDVEGFEGDVLDGLPAHCGRREPLLVDMYFAHADLLGAAEGALRASSNHFAARVRGPLERHFPICWRVARVAILPPVAWAA